MNTPGLIDGWYYDTLGEKTYPAERRYTYTDSERLEFFLRGWHVSSTCAGDQFFIHPLTGYFSTPREAVDCAMDILRQKEWRCGGPSDVFPPGCLERATYLVIAASGIANHTFKQCAEHVEAYQVPEARRFWKTEPLEKL